MVQEQRSDSRECNGNRKKLDEPKEAMKILAKTISPGGVYAFMI
jgi:hypothetical protein